MWSTVYNRTYFLLNFHTWGQPFPLFLDDFTKKTSWVVKPFISQGFKLAFLLKHRSTIKHSGRGGITLAWQHSHIFHTSVLSNRDSYCGNVKMHTCKHTTLYTHITPGTRACAHLSFHREVLHLTLLKSIQNKWATEQLWQFSTPVLLHYHISLHLSPLCHLLFPSLIFNA